MLLHPNEVRPSSIHGEGVFLTEGVSRGDVVGILSATSSWTTEEYLGKVERLVPNFPQTAVRLVDDYYIYNHDLSNEDYINHSFEPTCIYVLGILFARRDLEAGDELTVDYRYWCSTREDWDTVDSLTGKVVQGWPGRRALVEGLKDLLEVLGE